ncbi:MAG TPA: ribonuclease III [Candidatus Dojkabacteria bacterium]|nr:ribonuclease III [Candidatus Dojkabacteria bacterium]
MKTIRPQLSNEQIKKIENLLNYEFTDKKLLTRALTHRSFSSKTENSNERIEFLGDAVLELIISDFIYSNFTKFPEGRLTQLRSVMVRTETLAQTITGLNIPQFILMSKSERETGGEKKEKILANIFESLVGAIYKDSGYEKAKKFVTNTIIKQTEKLVSLIEEVDPKTKLQEIIQSNEKVTPEYVIYKEIGPAHDKIFYAKVLCNDKVLAKGKGHSKQKAEEDSARNALNNFPRN